MAKMANQVLLWWWQCRIKKIKRCRTPDVLIKRCGHPLHKLEESGVVVWHYPLRVVGATSYSIHVVIINDQVSQAYLHFEPTDPF